MNHRGGLVVWAIILIPVMLAAQIPGYGTEIESRIDAMVAQMTLDEKIGQLQQYAGGESAEHREMAAAGRVGSFLNVRGAESTNALQKLAVENSRLGIPLMFGLDVIHGYKTLFPIPLAEAASWNPELVERAAAVAAREARACGIHWTFAPMVDIARDPRWGRIAEGSGEDPYLGATLAAARVHGFQGMDLSAPDRIAACVKHYVAYGAAEGGRDYNTTEVSERTLRDVYLPPFAAAVRAGAATLMSAFNDLNGIPASANPFTLTDILRHEWGFKGFVVSDWNSIGELLNHGIAADSAEAAWRALSAGIEMDMEGRIYKNALPGLVERGLVSTAAIDEAVRRILRIKILLGLFENPYTDPDLEKQMLRTPENLAIARQMARESIVLLKNDKNILPLSRSARVAVIGPLADRQQDLLGTWACEGEAGDVITLLQGIRSAAVKPDLVLHARGCDVLGSDRSGFKEAIQLAKRSDVVIAVVGESADLSGEASSRADLALPGVQEQLVQEVAATGKPLVVVLLAGRPLTIPWIAEQVPAILMAWHGGVQAGSAVADVLFGDYNPSGRLPLTWPRTVGQVPLYYNHKNTGRPTNEQKWSTKYLDWPITPQYVFGFGRSYSTFAYSHLSLDKNEMGPRAMLTVSAVVKNSGRVAGDEVVQLYVRDLAGSVTRPVKELKGFKRVYLEPGESRKIEFTLGPGELGFHDAHHRHQVEPGRFKVWIGPNSAEGIEGDFCVR